MAPLVRTIPGASTLLLAVALLVGVGCSSSDSLPTATSDNPLPECPSSPNCERVSASYAVSPDSLFAGTQRALETLGPSQLQLRTDSLRASATYRVAWVFSDDVDVAVHPDEDGSVLHIRSASRTGYSDLGVNRRRVQHLLSVVDDAISTE